MREGEIEAHGRGKEKETMRTREKESNETRRVPLERGQQNARREHGATVYGGSTARKRGAIPCALQISLNERASERLHQQAAISPVTIKIIGYLEWKTTGRLPCLRIVVCIH